MEANKKTYSSEKIIKHYASAHNLQKPEEIILNLIKNNLSEFNMLDIGVGGGRTTIAFAHLVKHYTAIDYSEGMIANCKKNLLCKFPKAKFEVADVRELNSFKDNEFDFILYSFNGIDYVVLAPY